MWLRTFTVFFIIALMAIASSAAPSGSQHGHGEGSHKKPDIISGDWDAVFKIAGYSAEVTLKLKLDGEKLTGNGESEHTGPGTISNGSKSGDKLSFTLDFAAHESIAVTGKLKDGKLTGEFRTEGMVGQWEAKKK